MDKILASDKKCIKCGKQAEVFWPIIDPDIKANPYCNKCVDNETMKLLIAMDEIDHKINKKKM
jgi:hypothetical protein